MAKCGACGGRHQTVARVRECYQAKAWNAAMDGDRAAVEAAQRGEEEAEAAQVRAEREAEMAYERKLEDAGWEEARAEEIRDAERGVISFSDAMDAAYAEAEAERDREESRRVAEFKMARDGFGDDRLAREVAHKEAEELLADSGTASVREMMEELDAIAKSHGIVWSGAERAAFDTAVRTRYAKPGQRSGTGVVRHVSPKQVAFIERLMRERDTTNLVRLPGSEDFRHMSLKGATDLIDRLMACPELPEAEREVRPASERQRSYLLSLAGQKGIPLEAADVEGMSFEKASEVITSLKKMADAPREGKPEEKGMPDVPAGSYAIEIEGTLKFYRVDRPEEGRWAGYTFLSVQASDDFHPVKQPAAKRAILGRIAEDVRGAMERYGRELGECGHCHRTLTNEESRARGIGPVCASKMGW